MNQAPQLNPEKIIQVGMGFWASKTLLTATKMGLFTFLAEGPKDKAAICEAFDFHGRGVNDFLDALVALGFLQREGSGEAALYENTPEGQAFLNEKSPAYLGGMFEYANDILYGNWVNLEAALKSGKPQGGMEGSDETVFDFMYANPERMRNFLNGMAGFQLGNFMAFAQAFDFSNCKRFCDLGGALGALSIQVAKANPELDCYTFDLPMVTEMAKEYIEKAGLSERITALPGDFFKDELPEADVYCMGNILHDWGLDDKKKLLKRIYEALPEGGAFVAIENVIDADRRKNVFGMLMSIEMLLHTNEGFDYTETEFEAWAKEAGFSKVAFMPLGGPTSAAVAYK